jgi:predicted DNA-binding protein with PD1-like motif
METLPLRITPGADLRAALGRAVAERGLDAAFVIAGIGSLSMTRLRVAGALEPDVIAGDVEILTLSGTIGPAGSHLHASVADATGRVWGGHVAHGCIVRTTAEVLLALLPDWTFARQHDPATGFAELVVRRSSST